MKVTITETKMNRGQLNDIIDLLKDTTENGLEVILNDVTLTRLTLFQEKGAADMDKLLFDNLLPEEVETEVKEQKKYK